MKKLFVFFVLISMSTPFFSQLPKRPEIRFPKREIITANTGVRGFEHTTIKCEMTRIEGKGETFQFTSPVLISKVEVSFAVTPKTIETTNYGTGKKTGNFYLESEAYKGGQSRGYLFSFFTPLMEKPIYKCLLSGKK